MQKLFLLALFALILSSPVHAEEDAVAALEAEADNLAVTPPERRAKILDSANKKIITASTIIPKRKRKTLLNSPISLTNATSGLIKRIPETGSR